MRREYPIADRLPRWYFRITETSGNAWLAEGSDIRGRTVSCEGSDPDEILTKCIQRATVLLHAAPISFVENRLFAGSEELATFDYPIRDAFSAGKHVVVLLKYEAYPNEVKRCRNLLAVDRDGQKVWVAPLPTMRRSDAYYKIASQRPLVVYSVASYECEVDVRTGEFKRVEFYK